MATIFIVNHSTGGYHTYSSSFYHHTEEEARLAFEDSKESVGEDPAYIELVRLDTETLDAVTLDWWEGNIDDLEEDDEELERDENAAEYLSNMDEPLDNDDWIVEGKPDGE